MWLLTVVCVRTHAFMLSQLKYIWYNIYVLWHWQALDGDWWYSAVTTWWHWWTVTLQTLWLYCDVCMHVWILGSPPCPVQWHIAQPAGCLYYADWHLIDVDTWISCLFCLHLVSWSTVHLRTTLVTLVVNYLISQWWASVVFCFCWVNNLKLCAMVPWGV